MDHYKITNMQVIHPASSPVRAGSTQQVTGVLLVVVKRYMYKPRSIFAAIVVGVAGFGGTVGGRWGWWGCHGLRCDFSGGAVWLQSSGASWG